MDMRVNPKAKLKLVMVGNGMAGVRTIEELLKLAPDLYDITVFGAEPHPNYNRILLSPVLAGEQTLDEIVLNDWAWYSDNGITLHAGKTVTEVDRVKRVVRATDADGSVIEAPYDRLIMATGSNPFMLPIPGKDLAGVLAYRDIADTQAMIDARCRHWRWSAGPGSSQWSDEARHDGECGARGPVAHGATARRGGGPAAAGLAGRARHDLPDGCADAGTRGW